MAHAGGRPTDCTPETELRYMPEYIYAKTAAELLGMTKFSFDLLSEGNEYFPLLYNRGTRKMYKYKEIIEYAQR